METFQFLVYSNCPFQPPLTRNLVILIAFCSAFHVTYHYFRSKMEDQANSYSFIREFNSSISSRQLHSVYDGQYVTYLWMFFRFTRMLMTLLCFASDKSEHITFWFQNSITVVFGEFSNQSDRLVHRSIPLIHAQFEW